MLISGTYNLKYNPLWRQQPLEAIYLECDTSIAPVTINLFEIAETQLFWNVKFFISDKSNNCSVNNITVNSGGSDTIDASGQTSFVINTNGTSVELQIAGPTKWLVLEAKSNISTNVIEIPRPEISISASQGTYGTCQDLYAHYLPTTNNTFLNYNPKYYLFIQKSRNNSIKKDINGNKYRKKKPSGIFHPTHQNGINSTNGAFYSGTTQIPLDTEFSISNTPYIKSLINMNPLQFVRFNDLNPNNWVVPTLGDFPAPIWAFKIGGKKKPKGRSFLMYLAIGIENPDTSSNFPIIFGQLSIPFKLALKKEKDIVYLGNTYKAVVGVQYLINSSSVKIKNIL